MASSRRRYNELVRALVGGGYRLTPQREAVLRVLAGATEHPGAEQIYTQARQRCRSTSRATVYNTVSVLKQLGEIEELELAGTGHHYGAHMPAHDAHSVCTRCGRIDDYERTELSAALDAAAAASDYRVTSRRLYFYGECPTCREQVDHPE